MRFFSVPADFSNKTIDRYLELHRNYPNTQVIETYGQISIGNSFESGRINQLLPQIDFDGLKRYVQYSSDHGIDFNYTFNAPYMHNSEFQEEGIKNIKKFLMKIRECGVQSLTIALPSLMELVMSMDVGFKVKASTVCQINTANKAAHYKKIGTERIVVDEMVARDFDTLEKIINVYGSKVEIIANSLCNRECVYRMFHYNQTCGYAHAPTDGTGSGFYTTRCALRVLQNYSQLMHMGWIRPEDMIWYEKCGIQYYKLQGREYVMTGDVVKAVEVYAKGEYEGNLMELLDLFSTHFRYKYYVDNKKLDGFVKGFFENRNLCRNDCEHCNYCKTFAEKSVVFDERTLLLQQSSKMFDTHFNEYKQMVKSISIDLEEEPMKEDDDIEIAFNL